MLCCAASEDGNPTPLPTGRTGAPIPIERSTKPRPMAKPSKIRDVSLPFAKIKSPAEAQSILNKVISGYERRNLAGKISKNRHLCLAEVKGKTGGQGPPWGSRPTEIRKSSAIIFRPRRATRFESPIGGCYWPDQSSHPPASPEDSMCQRQVI